MKSLIFMKAIILMSLCSFANAKELTLADFARSKSALAGNFFGPKGFGGSGVEFEKDLSFSGAVKFPRLRPYDKLSQYVDYPIYFENNFCFISGFEENRATDIIEKNDIYGIYSMELRGRTLSITVSNLYRWPTNLDIQCEGDFSEKTPISEIEDALDGVLNFE